MKAVVQQAVTCRTSVLCSSVGNTTGGRSWRDLVLLAAIIIRTLVILMVVFSVLVL